MDVMVIPNRGRVVAVIWALALAGGLLTLELLLAKPTQAQAQTEHFNERTPQTFEFFACTGEWVVVEGTLHVVGTTTQDADGKVHVQGHSDFGGEGVGITSGAEYVVRELGNQAAFAEDVNDPFGSASFTQTYTRHVMRKGSTTPEDDSLVRVTFHITIVNGEVTSEVVEESAECK
jgi:hypothetical protein